MLHVRGHGPHSCTFMLPPLLMLLHLFTSSVSVLYLALSNSHSLTSLFGILVHSSTILKPILQIQTLAASNAIGHSPLCLQCLAAATTVHSSLCSYCQCQYFSVSLIFLFCYFRWFHTFICYGNQKLKSNKLKDL